jgi:hypothetical protein
VADKQYQHRANRDLTYDSICLLCFATVATVSDTQLLEGPEINHICNESFLADRGEIQKRLPRQLILVKK